MPQWLYEFERGGPRLLEVAATRVVPLARLRLEGRELGWFVAWPGRVVRLPVTLRELHPPALARDGLEVEVTFGEYPEVRLGELRIAPVAVGEEAPLTLTRVQRAHWRRWEAVSLPAPGRAARATFATLSPLLLLLLGGSAVAFASAAVALALLGAVAVAAVLGWMFARERLVIVPEWGIRGWLRPVAPGRVRPRWWQPPRPLIATWDGIDRIEQRAHDRRGSKPAALVRLGFGEAGRTFALPAGTTSADAATAFLAEAHAQSQASPTSAPVWHAAAEAHLLQRAEQLTWRVTLLGPVPLGLLVCALASRAALLHTEPQLAWWLLALLGAGLTFGSAAGLWLRTPPPHRRRPRRKADPRELQSETLFP